MTYLSQNFKEFQRELIFYESKNMIFELIELLVFSRGVKIEMPPLSRIHSTLVQKVNIIEKSGLPVFDHKKIADK